MSWKRTFPLDIISVLFWCLKWITPAADANNLYLDPFVSLDVPPAHMEYHLRRIRTDSEQCDAGVHCKVV